MKRVLTFLAIMLLPLSVWAMTPVTDSDLSNVTGQAGVNINADLTMNISIGTMAWGDADGISSANQGLGYSSMGGNFSWLANGSTSGGYIGVSNFNLTNLTIKARTGDTFDGYSSATGLKPITIDVATGGSHGDGVSFVRIGLGSLEIGFDSLSLDVGLSDRDTPDVLEQNLGVMSIGNTKLYIDPTSYVDIFAHGGSGVTMNFNIQFDNIEFGYLSWGDKDGLGTAGTTAWIGADGTDAGYVGLSAINFGLVTITGSVLIDVVQIATPSIYAAHYLNNAVVHIGFGDNFNISVGGPITANVVLASDAPLSTNVGLLGDIYLSGMNIGIVNGSWVDIWAH